MTVQATNDLAGFHDFVANQLKHGGSNMTPEQALALWRARVETIESVQRGLPDVEAGRTRPADEVLEELRDELRGQ